MNIVRRKLILVTVVCSVKWRNLFFLRKVQGLSSPIMFGLGYKKKYQLHTRCDIWKGTWQEAVLKAWKCAMESLKETKKSQTRTWVPTFSEGTLMKNKLWRSLLFTWLPMVRYSLTMQFSFNFILFYPRLVHACLLIRSSPRKAGKRSMYCFNFLNKRWLILESILPFLVEIVGLEAEIHRSSPFGGISKLLAIEMTRPTSSWCREMARLITCYSQVEGSPKGSR